MPNLEFPHAQARRAASLVLAVTVIALSVISIVDNRGGTVPPEHQKTKSSDSLKHNDVLLADLQICDCWEGPRRQAQKKIRLKVDNNSSEELNLAGGPNSSIYLVVAYKIDFSPVVVDMPADSEMAIRSVRQLQSVPAGIKVAAVEKRRRVPAIRLGPNLEKDMGLQKGWAAWALPANPNKVVEVEPLASGRGTYPTYVTKTRLQEGRSYHPSSVPGMGDWVFYLPLPEAVADVLSTRTIPSPPESYWDQYIKIIGVTALSSHDHALLGFAPAPPPSAWLDEAEF